MQHCFFFFKKESRGCLKSIFSHKATKNTKNCSDDLEGFVNLVSLWDAFNLTFEISSSYFNPSTSSFMINFRVMDLSKLLETLKQEGVKIVGEIVEEEYGKFGWILDPEGNKIELWELYDDKF